MKPFRIRGPVAAALFGLAVFTASASGDPVRESHPRILLDSTTRAKLITKKNNVDPSWTALKSRADQLKGYPVEPFTYSTRGNWYSNRIFYGYQGTEWYEAVMPLGLAYQMTGDTLYSSKLLQLADEILRAENDPANKPPTGMSPMRVNISYASRYVCPTVAVIYDWCYDRLGDARKAKMITLMNTYFDSLRSSYNYQSYENNGPAIGNYFGGHLFAVAYMGYATYGDNPRAQQMIDWARIRFDGATSSLLTAGDIPTSNRVAAFNGPYPSEFERRQGLAPTGAPFKGGFNFQGWSYGPNEFVRTVDYMLTVKSATGEDLTAAHQEWFTTMFRSLKHALMPNRIVIDPVGDWGGNQGSVISRSLPARVAHVLANTADSAAVQHFVYTEIPQNTTYGYYAKDVQIYAMPAWERFYFVDPARTSTPGQFPLYNSPFAPAYPKGTRGNGAIPRFTWRSGWDTSATWMGAEMGAAFYGDHQMNHAGHLYITRGRDQLLISPSNWRGAAPGMGVIGSGISYVVHSSLKNTLFFDDYGDYQRTSVDQHGGQSNAGCDRVTAAGMNAAHTYLRSDLSTAYNNTIWPRVAADTVNRKLEHFYRTILYLRNSNIAVVHDQVKAKASTNPRGAYEKHLRWHFPVSPVISGKSVRASHGASTLYLHTLLPTALSLKSTSLVSNPDNRWGSSFNYAFNSSTWRVEVRDTVNPLELPFLTVIQTGPASAAEMTTATITAADSLMIGARIASPSGIDYVLFNNRPGAAPTEITSVSYSADETTATTHTLCGMVPNASYSVSVNEGIVTATEEPTGAWTATDAGVLSFVLDGTSGALKSASPLSGHEAPAGLSVTAFPNPASTRIEFGYTVPQGAGQIRLSIFDMMGREVTTLVDAPTTAGRHSVEIDLNGSALGPLPNGTYYCRATAGESTGTARFVLMR